MITSRSSGNWPKGRSRVASLTKGRLFPEGLHFKNSWVNKEKNICFQLMEANDPELFDAWFEKWNDLVDFELCPID